MTWPTPSSYFNPWSLLWGELDRKDLYTVHQNHIYLYIFVCIAGIFVSTVMYCFIERKKNISLKIITKLIQRIPTIVKTLIKAKGDFHVENFLLNH